MPNDLNWEDENGPETFFDDEREFARFQDDDYTTPSNEAPEYDPMIDEYFDSSRWE